jgi:3-hydroxyacyl-CoA dehydrogenase
MSAVVHHETHKGGVAVITLDNPPVNALSVGKGVLQGVLDHVKAAEHDPDVRVILLIGAGRNFSGGADITEFGKPPVPGKATLRDLLAYLDTVTKPICAAIAGPTMGGGLELALGAHWRCAITGAQIGLPEVKLGILPGAGGTQRLPRLIGVEAALPMIVGGDPVTTERALALGIVDEIVTGDLRTAAIAWAAKLVKDGRASVRRTSAMTARLPDGVDADAFFAQACERVAKDWRGYPAPLECVACVEAAVKQPFAAGLKFERERFEHLVATDESRALRHAFFAERAAGKVDGLPDDVPVRPIKSVAVIGAGTMGGGIAMNFVNVGIPVKLVERAPEALQRGLATIAKNYAATVSKGRLAQDEMDRRMALLTPVDDYAQLADVDLVVEAVFEEMDVKQQVFRALDAVVKPGAILATNTSTLDIDAIAAVTQRPADVIGLHFFSPANVMKLLEIVRGARTAPDVIATAMKLAKTIRKVGVLVGVCDGFVGNRMVAAYFREAAFLLEEGASPQQVDRAMEDFGFAMGPFRVSDLAGLDIGWAIRKRQAVTRDPSERYAAAADRLCERGRFGQKTGAGWYRYEPGRRDPIPDPEVDAIIVQTAAEAGVARRDIDATEIVERCVYQLVNVGAQLLDEGIAQRASDIDIVYLFGYGFPRYRGGPMFHADLVGLPNVVAAMERYRASVGEWWAPAEGLVRRAAEGGRFGG